MSDVIGQTATYSTWAVCRTPFGNGSPYAGGTVRTDYGHNVEYDKGFTWTDGRFTKTSPYYNKDNPPPRFVYEDTGSTPTSTAGMFYMWGLLFPGNLLTADDYAELLGETVTMTSGSFTITADAWTVPPSFQTVSGGLGSITAIGKLTAF